MKTTDLEALLVDVADSCRRNRRGRVANYIPELKDVDPDGFVIAACSVAGETWSAGDADVAVTIQSMCKPFLYGAALEMFGPDRVHTRVDTEPTGLEFDSYTRLEAGTCRPANPMVNAGAIAITDLLMVDSNETAESPAPLTKWLARFAGRETLSHDPAIFDSERSHGSRNRVIAHLMKQFGLITHDVEHVLNGYFHLCSLKVSCVDLAVMASCLANGGVCSVSGERVIGRASAETVLAVMTTCGMYDSSGRFAYEVGLPAKSGVSGGIIACVPGRFGLAVCSPRLDASGNSVAGWAALRRVSRKISGHCFGSPQLRPGDIGDQEINSALVSSRRAARVETGGHVAAYLPRVDPALHGIAICTVDGDEIVVGDADSSFSLQAVANPLAFALALQQHGEAVVRRLVGVEPSGNPFHAILIDRRLERPYNPLGNAGALVMAGLNTQPDETETTPRVLAWLAGLAGKDEAPVVDQAVLEAEWHHGARNRAIAYLLQEKGLLSNVDEALSLYFQQCAMLVTCRTLARIAGVLASGGVRPGRGDRILSPSVVRGVLTVMYTCGMHDQSGRFAMEVGLPAKSGISGGIMAVVPGRMGIAAYSPPVDQAGISIRGRASLREFCRELAMGVFADRI